MDALMPLASLPTQISGRNRAWRKMIIDVIRTDPDWKDGNYQAQPRGLRFAVEMMFMMSSNAALRQQQAPTLAQADAMLEKYVVDALKRTDANDLAYAVESSYDYD